MKNISFQKHFHRIIVDGKEVGYIQILSYNSDYPQIEYNLDDEYHNKGIMTREVKNYLEAIKNDYKVITAVVKENNLASIRVLIKNGFIQIPFGKAGYKIYLKML
ncbi:MAG: N-acetyltransferase [Proteobacteria bacterium]|nr:N-acetyltransferase [Pseudomonadota bacterium]NCA28505.1 N-acetyltransferase [Pseudomonadota bacterium]